MIHKGDNIVGLPPKTILEKGISMSFIPEDRLGMGLAPSMSITDNMILKNYGETKGPFVDRKAGRAAGPAGDRAAGRGHPLHRDPSASAVWRKCAESAAGPGEIKAGPNVIVTAYPVRGLDINSSYAIYNILNQQKKDGVGILFVGEDLDVMLALCDKIMVLCHGKVMGVVHAHKTSKEELGLMMTGALDLTYKYEDKPAGIAGTPTSAPRSCRNWSSRRAAARKERTDHAFPYRKAGQLSFLEEAVSLPGRGGRCPGSGRGCCCWSWGWIPLLITSGCLLWVW